MSNQLEKLKSSIKKEYIDNFELNLMKSSGFIPVDKRQGKLYTIISQRSLKEIENIRETVSKKVEAYGGVEFIPVGDSIFEEVYSYVDNLIKHPETIKKEENPVTAEDMLVTIGWITKEQLQESQKLAQEKGVPLDAIFHEKNFLTYEQIVSYLKKKFGCDVISKSNIALFNPKYSLISIPIGASAGKIINP